MSQSSALTPAPILQMLTGFHVTAVLRTAVQLGVFERLASGPASADAVAAAIKADTRGARILLDALCAIGLAEVQGDAYACTPLSATFLVRGKPTFIGGLAQIFAPDWAYEAFGKLKDAVVRGGTVLEKDAEAPSHPWWGDFAENIAGFAGPASEAMAEMLAPWCAGRARLDVLDVACGNGFYGLRIAQKNRHARVWEADWPHVLEVTRRSAAKLEVADRAQYIAGDVFSTPLGGPYDLAILANILHHFGEERCVELLRRVAAVMAPDGRLVIQELIPTGVPAEDPMPRLFSVLMLVWTRHGETYSLPRLERMLARAGFGAPTLHDLPGTPSRLLVADRAA